MPYASNTRISGPIPIAATGDVSFNGLEFNYQLGLMFPATAALNTTYIAPPPISSIHNPNASNGPR